MTEPTKAAPIGPNGESPSIEATAAPEDVSDKNPRAVSDWVDIILFRETPGSDRPIAFMACALRQFESIAQSLSAINEQLAKMTRELAETRGELAKRPQARVTDTVSEKVH